MDLTGSPVRAAEALLQIESYPTEPSAAASNANRPARETHTRLWPWLGAIGFALVCLYTAVFVG